jgi:hypothetical protein
VSGSTDDVSKKNKEVNDRSSKGSDSGKNAGRK